MFLLALYYIDLLGCFKGKVNEILYCALVPITTVFFRSSDHNISLMSLTYEFWYGSRLVFRHFL